MDLFRNWRNNANLEPMNLESVDLEVEICYFCEDDKKQITLTVPLTEYFDAPKNSRFG